MQFNFGKYSTIEKVQILLATGKQLKATIQKRDKAIIQQSQTAPSSRSSNSRGGKLTSLFAATSRYNDLIETHKEHILQISKSL